MLVLFGRGYDFDLMFAFGMMYLHSHLQRGFGVDGCNNIHLWVLSSMTRSPNGDDCFVLCFVDCITSLPQINGAGWFPVLGFRTLVIFQTLGEGHVRVTSVTVILVCWMFGLLPISHCLGSIRLHWAFCGLRSGRCKLCMSKHVVFRMYLWVNYFVLNKNNSCSCNIGVCSLFFNQDTIICHSYFRAWQSVIFVLAGYYGCYFLNFALYMQQQLLHSSLIFVRKVASRNRNDLPLFQACCLCPLQVLGDTSPWWLHCRLRWDVVAFGHWQMIASTQLTRRSCGNLRNFVNSHIKVPVFFQNACFSGTFTLIPSSEPRKDEDVWYSVCGPLKTHAIYDVQSQVRVPCLFVVMLDPSFEIVTKLLPMQGSFLLQYFGLVRLHAHQTSLCIAFEWDFTHEQSSLLISSLLCSSSKNDAFVLCPYARSFPWTSKFVWLYRIFDATLGYPGEGPTDNKDKTWKCISANIDSIQSNMDFLHWDHDVCFLQETRLTNLNFDANIKTVKQCGKHIFPGDLLKEKADKNGVFKSPHGGCAILAPQATTRTFESKDDETGKWESLHRSTRVSAVWHQIAKNTRLLCITFYGHSGTNENNNHDVNDNMIDNIFAVCSQYGDIPIVFTGDFQADPDQYSSVTKAKQTGMWFDPLVTCDEDGTTHRPITYSRNSDFISPKEYFSSIDAMLVNSIALSSLKQMRVCHEYCRPHAPIEAIFDWNRLTQTGYILVKPAAFDFDSIAKKEGKIDRELLQNISKNIWNQKYESRFHNASDEKAWKYINNLGKETLITAGAKFGVGPKTRGQQPVFEKKIVFPGQNTDGCAFTTQSAKLAKAHKLVTELRYRYQRNLSGYDDFINTFNLQNRVAKTLGTIPECKWWKIEHHCFEEGIIQVQKCLQKAIAKNCVREKRQRISSWKQKMINGTRSRNVSKFIYKWLRNKTQPCVPNLIRNANGDILFSPIEAINEINEQWDSVFSANALHQDPKQVLSEIWPIVSRIRNPISLPELTGTMLKTQAESRRIDAAAGIDGWRTIETKILPLQVYDLIAKYFRDVERGERQLPSILTTARQIILHKGGDDIPLQKRLISILPIFMITYTSLRFKHLQHWQTNTLPGNLFGGIQTRKMSQLQMHFRLTLDDARRQNQALIGVKLDKSKCFDRLLPDVSCVILLGLGVPQSTLRVFASLYGNLKRFLSYQSWTSHVSTTCANGVIQGCSFSLLAVNAHMTIWSAYMNALPDICAAAYIDDCYVWTKLENQRILQQAMTATNNWDNLTGQLANHRKSVAWSTTNQGRRSLKTQFPEMQHHHIVEILGVSMQTTLQTATGWDKAKTTKAIRDLKLIRALPCSRDVHSHLAGVKVIPQISFSPHLNHIPKHELTSIQDCVVDLLWKNRPMWRSRGLVLALLANPTRVDPFTTRAYRTIAECIQFLKNCPPTDREKWRLQCGMTQHPHSAVSTFRNACDYLGVTHISEFHISFCNSEPLCILDFSFRELKRFLDAIARHNCYQYACKASRKDIRKCEGILDCNMTNLGTRACKGTFIRGLELTCFRDSSVVGCTPTNDRRIKANTSDTNLCRFCNLEVESLEHIICNCTGDVVPSRPMCPQHLGPNFELLGIAEIDQTHVRDRLSCSDTSTIPVTDWHNPEPDFCRVWTDGSCTNPQFFWHMKGGFSVVDSHGRCLSSGQVKHVSLSSYTCELWAIIVAFAQASGPVLISTDNETAVKQVKHMIEHDEIKPAWQHFQWWSFLHHIYRLRKIQSQQPLLIRWIPAHLLEEIPCEYISNQAAREAGSTWIDIYCNRKADYFAKESVFQNQNPQSISDNLIDKIMEWQKWLALLNAELSKTETQTESQPAPPAATPADNCDQVARSFVCPHEITIQHTTNDFKRLLPKWCWTPDINDFTWVSHFPDDLDLKSYANISNHDWKLSVSFLKSLKWMEGPSLETAYVELAFYFWFCGHRFQAVDESPGAYTKVLRKAINQAFKLSENPLTPGKQHSKCKCKGRVLPAGTLVGCYPFVEPDALKHLAVHVLHGRPQAITAWECSF